MQVHHIDLLGPLNLVFFKFGFLLVHVSSTALLLLLKFISLSFRIFGHFLQLFSLFLRLDEPEFRNTLRYPVFSLNFAPLARR